jgi:hypothetical protein
MDKKYQKIVNSGNGNGKLFEDEIFVGNVIYQFRIDQEFTSYETTAGIKTLPGMKMLSGLVKPQNWMIDISGKILKLELKDKRTLNVAFTSGDFINQEFQIFFV